ncbi:chaperonin 10-like protein [Aspergillus germanicus]
MQAVIFKEPLRVAVEQRPIPVVQDPRMRFSSELHVYRGHQSSSPGFIMGHEFTGEVIEVGPEVQDFAKGDLVVVPFTVNCGRCFYCRRELSSRCVDSKLFGSPALDGGQAEYVRVPMADFSLIRAPEGIDEKKLVFMADIFPTGYFAASNAFKGMDGSAITESTVLLLGCGPVGLFALISALEYRPKHLIAVDRVASRLQRAEELGAEVWNFESDRKGLEKRVRSLTDGRGADVVIEVVGHADALRLGFDLLRPSGRISSVGVHNEPVPWTGFEAYSKNLTIQTGRCPARSMFKEAVKLFAQKQDALDFMVADVRPLSQAPQSYDDFNHMRSQKIIFEAAK